MLMALPTWAWPSVKVLPAKDGATKEAAEIFKGIIRNIEQQSIARAAYTKAAENAAQAGIGGWRVVTQYSSDDSFDQDIRIKRINDPFQILVDPLAQEPDKSDMRYGFVFEDLAAFVRWCEADPIRFDHPVLYGRLRRQGDEHFRAHP